MVQDKAVSRRKRSKAPQALAALRREQRQTLADLRANNSWVCSDQNERNDLAQFSTARRPLSSLQPYPANHS
jgi:hypothetical protein